MKKLVLLSAIIALVGCKNSKDDLKPVNDSNQTTNAVGPFDVEFNPETLIYESSFFIPIQQDEGVVDYFIQMNRSEDIIIEDVKTSVSGCDVSQVVHTMLWINDSTSAYGKIVSKGHTISTVGKIKGNLIQQFKGLNGCKEIQLSLRLRKKFKESFIGKACQPDMPVSECKIKTYCRENYMTNFAEVEIWKYSSQILLVKYMNDGNGNRTKTLTTTVAYTEDEQKAFYDSTSFNQSRLQLNKTTLVGSLSEVYYGQAYTISMSCEIE